MFNPIEEMMKTKEPLSINDWDEYERNLSFDELLENSSKLRTRYTQMFCFPIISKEFIKEFTEKFKGKRILEVMSGNGYLAKQLDRAGFEIIATDNKDWAFDPFAMYGTWKAEYYNILKFDARHAIKLFKDDIDIVLMSWPPYAETIGAEVADLCRKFKKDLIIIGESQGGCTGDDQLFDIIDDYEQEFPIPSFRNFYGIHDDLSVVYFSKDKKVNENE